MFVLKPLARRPIALLWAGQVLAATGSEFYMVAVIWIAADLIGRDAGYVSAVQAGALLAGSLFGGLLTDRWRHRTTMVAVDLVRAALVLVLSAAGLLQVLTLPLLIVVACAVALATAAFDPALQATVPAIAPDPAMRHATNSLFDATRRMARILAPSLIAVVNGILPKTQFFALTALAYALSAAAVIAALRGPRAGTAPAGPSGMARIVDGLVGGARAVRGHGLVIYGMVANLVGNLTWAAGVLLGMVLYLRETSTDPLTDYSLMMTGYGVGNLATNLLLSGRPPKRPGLWIVTSKLIFGTGVLLLPFAPDRVWLMAIAAFAATNGPLENLATLHLMQSRFPPQRLAQVYRLQMCAIFAGLLLAYLAAPALYGLFGLAPVIIAAGTLTVATGLAGAAGLLLHRHRATARAGTA